RSATRAARGAPSRGRRTPGRCSAPSESGRPWQTRKIPAFNIADLFELVADTVPDREAVVCGERRLTYRELDERATRLAHALQTELGIEPGDHVGLQLYDSAQHLEAMLACYKARAVPINVNWRYVADELRQVLADAGAKALFHEPEMTAVMEPSVARGDQYEALVAKGSPERDFAPRSGDDHYILYTGHDGPAQGRGVAPRGHLLRRARWR